ncbi:MAG TPA: response regulator transcription factor [Bacteroidia bacterium]|nr:response regulator transcription factor [Bacteroidia bacterium]
MEQQKILIIEDEQKVASFISKGLEEYGYITEIAPDGLTGKNKAKKEKFELILLDINLPELNGLNVCKEIRYYTPNIPILMLTALGTTEDKLSGFEAGADDYLIKPFEFKELLARIKALLKRAGGMQQENILTIADLKINLDAKTVTRAEKKIELTAKEFQLLEFLIRNKGKVLSRAQIAEKVWEINFDSGTNVIDVYINFLRNEIDKNFEPKLIHTVVGMGYVMKIK